MQPAISAQRLMIKLTVYFVLVFGGLFTASLLNPHILTLLPIGGTDAMEIAGIDFEDESLDGLFGDSEPVHETTDIQDVSARQVGLVALYLAFSLGGTILVMLPNTWTYIATKREIGYR